MANSRITDLTEDTTPASNDWLVTVDVSDPSDSPQGTNKKVQVGNLADSGPTINPSDNRIPYRSGSSAFGDSLLTHDAANGQTTAGVGHFMASQNLGKVIGFGNSTIAFGGFKASGQGCVKVVADAAGNPGSIVSDFVAAPLPGGNPTPWSSAGMNFEHTLTSSGQTIGNPGNHGGDGTAPSGYRFVLVLIQDPTGSRTVNWGTDIKFPSGVLPTLTTTPGAIDIFEFIVRNDIAHCIGQFLDSR